jgi:hypothetical protein
VTFAPTSIGAAGAEFDVQICLSGTDAPNLPINVRATAP